MLFVCLSLLFEEDVMAVFTAVNATVSAVRERAPAPPERHATSPVAGEQLASHMSRPWRASRRGSSFS